MGAKVIAHAFEGYAAQRNWALDTLPFAHPWILMLDADEWIPAPLAQEIEKALADPTCEGYLLKRRSYFMGRWIRHGGMYPTWILRLFRRGAGRFEERPMNEHVLLKGRTGALSEPFDHWDTRPLEHWVAKHNHYAGLEAEEYIQEKFGGGYRHALPARFGKNHPERKRWIKVQLWNRLPLLSRPFLLFFRNYLLKAGFLDGREGFIFHVLWSFWFPFLSSAKIIEKLYASQHITGTAKNAKRRAAACGPLK
jgi:hypothetical protein